MEKKQSLILNDFKVLMKSYKFHSLLSYLWIVFWKLSEMGTMISSIYFSCCSDVNMFSLLWNVVPFSSRPAEESTTSWQPTLKLPRTGLTGSTALSEVVRITLDGCIGILLDVLDYRLSHKCPNLLILSACCWRTQVLPFSPVQSPVETAVHC